MHNFPATDRLIRRVRGCSQRLGIHRLDYALAYRDRDQGILVLLGVLWALMSLPAVAALHRPRQSLRADSHETLCRFKLGTRWRQYRIYL